MQSWLKFAGTTVLALSVSGCPAPQEGVAAITLSSSPRYIDDTGQSTTVRVTALDAAGQPGKGDVVLTAGAGFLGTDNQKTLTVTLDAQGKATANFSCPVARDTGCKGFVRVEGDWNEINNGTSVQVTTTTGSTGGNDAGTNPGGGNDAGTNPGGGNDAGTNPGGGTDAGTNPGGGEAVGVPANIVFLSSSAKAQLGIRSSGLETATPLTFVVLDLSGNRVKDAEVTFSVIGPAGVSLTALTSKTNAQGQATVLLQSGDEVGVATVTARVTGTPLFVSTLGTSIVGARVSDDGFALECVQLNLAANASDTPPRLDLGTPCTAKLVDRFTNPVTLSTTVNWYAEAGSIKSPVTNGGIPTGPGSGGGEGGSTAVTAFSTAGKWPPAPVSPLTSPAEPFVGTYNPRDMLVTLIAVTVGEEEFSDGSGLSAGVKDGKWNPGEWFVDVPEPFVDANDNQVYDLGEQFIDTERVDCATGARQAKNGRWDGPNGCWDGDIMLWRPTHVLYSGFNNLQPARWTVLGPGRLPPPYTVAKGSGAGLSVAVTDAYLNRMSPDSADIVSGKVGDRGGVELPYVDGAINSRTYGFQLFHERVEVVADAAQPRGYRVVGTCDPSKVPPAGASTDPKLARCVRQYRFGQFGADNVATVALKGADAADTKPGQTIPVYLTATNAYSTATYFFDVTFQ